MVEVVINLLPLGLRFKMRELGRIEIWNDETGTEERGNYRVLLRKMNGKDVWKQGRVIGFDRRKGGYDLLYLALQRLVGYRNEIRGATREEWLAWSYETARRTKTKCIVCDTDQVYSPGGVTCRNHHCNADGYRGEREENESA